MYRLLVLTSQDRLAGTGPRADLERQLSFLKTYGVSSVLLVDPPQEELEQELRRSSYNCVFTTTVDSYPTLQPEAQAYNLFRTLEHLRQPVVGSGLFEQLLVRDKALLADRSGLALPGHLVTRAEGLAGSEWLQRGRSADPVQFPAIVKPNSLSCSLGLDDESIVDSLAAARERVNYLFARFPDLEAVRIEPYLANAREFTVSVLGNDTALCHSAAELVSEGPGHSVYDERQKSLPLEERSIRYEASLPDSIESEILFHAKRLFRWLGLRDFARFDFLFEGRAYLMDANALPVLGNSFSWAWQEADLVSACELLAVVLAAFHYRRGASGHPDPLPTDLLRSLPRPLIETLRQTPAIGGLPESTPSRPQCEDTERFLMVDRVAVEVDVLHFLRSIVQVTKPDLAVETGTYKGASAAAIAAGLEQNGHGHLVTIEQDEELAKRAAERLRRLPVSVVQGNSREYVPPKKIDFLYLDSSRKIRGLEFAHYRRYLSRRAVIIWHDSSPEHRTVFRQVEELRRKGEIDRLILPTPRGLSVAMRKDWPHWIEGRYSMSGS